MLDFFFFPIRNSEISGRDPNFRVSYGFQLQNLCIIYAASMYPHSSTRRSKRVRLCSSNHFIACGHNHPNWSKTISYPSFPFLLLIWNFEHRRDEFGNLLRFLGCDFHEFSSKTRIFMKFSTKNFISSEDRLKCRK